MPLATSAKDPANTYRSAFSLTDSPRALPYVGGYQVPVNTPPFFKPTLHPMTPFFYSVHAQWPTFFTFVSANFSALRAYFEKCYDFVAILTENLQILPWNSIFAHWMTPILGSPHQKSSHFFLVPTPNDLFFSTKSYTEHPLFSFSGRHLYVTFILSAPGIPPPFLNRLMPLAGIYVYHIPLPLL